jgi:hypothetical protein
MRRSLFVTLAWVVLSQLSLAQIAQTTSEIRTHHKMLYGEYHTGKNILKELNAGRNIHLSTVHYDDYVEDINASKIPANAYPHPNLRGIACDADAIIIGVPNNPEAALSSSGDFVYTDYQFRADTVLKNPPRVDLASGREIIVTRPGGELKLNGHEANIQVTR